MSTKLREEILQLIWCKERQLIKVEGEDADANLHGKPWGRVTVPWPRPETHKGVGVRFRRHLEAENAARQLAAELVYATNRAEYKEIVAEWFMCQSPVKSDKQQMDGDRCDIRQLIKVEGKNADLDGIPWGRVTVYWPRPENNKWVGVSYGSRLEAENAARQLAGKHAPSRAIYKETVAEWFMRQVPATSEQLDNAGPTQANRNEFVTPWARIRA
jgi:hypothetical protein